MTREFPWVRAELPRRRVGDHRVGGRAVPVLGVFRRRSAVSCPCSCRARRGRGRASAAATRRHATQLGDSRTVDRGSCPRRGAAVGRIDGARGAGRGGRVLGGLTRRLVFILDPGCWSLVDRAVIIGLHGVPIRRYVIHCRLDLFVSGEHPNIR